MKRFIAKSILALAAVFTLASCVQEKYETEQFGGVPTLTAFAPNPIFRGGELTFIGSYLEQVKEVQVPGVDPITDITVETSGAKSRIKVTLPNSTEEVGVLTLVTKSGTKLVSKTELTYTEPIVFESFSPKNAMPGDVVTIKGDYMNLVQEVIFEGGAYAVEDAITEQSRNELKVVVPANAISGRFILGDTNEVADPDNVANKIYSDSELTIGDPTVKENPAVTVKAGDKITVNGAYLQMIAKVAVSGVEVPFDNVANTKAILYVPAEAGDGDIVFTSFAGKEFKAGTITTIVPGSVKAAPSPVKAGAELTITGSNLDLVTTVDLNGANGVPFVYTDGRITLTVPGTAKDGNVTLNLANGKSVTAAYKTVVPTITTITPLEITAGETFTIAGTNLDLVKTVKLGPNAEEFVLAEDVITVTTSATSVAGKITLVLENKEEVVSTDEMVVNYDSFIVVSEMPKEAHIGAIVTLKGSNFMMIESIKIGEEKVTKYVARADDEIQFIMPFNKVGTYSITFTLLTGEVEVCPVQIDVLLEQYFIAAWEGNLQISWSDEGKIGVPIEKFDGVAAGSKMRFYYSQVDQQWDQAQLNNGAWTTIAFPEIPSGTLVPTDIYGWFSDGILDRITEVTLTKDVLENIRSNAGDFNGVTCGLIIQGSGLTFTKIEIVGEISQETTLWEGEAIADAWGNQPNLLSDAGLELAAANAQAGQTVFFYMEPIRPSEGWKVQFVEGHWGPTYASICSFGADTEDGKFTEYDLEGNGGKYGLVLTQEMLDAAMVQQWWGGTFLANGDNVKITKITLL